MTKRKKVSTDLQQWLTRSCSQDNILSALLKKKLKVWQVAMILREFPCRYTLIIQVTPSFPPLTPQMPRNVWCLSRNCVKRSRSKQRRDSLRSRQWKTRTSWAKNSEIWLICEHLIPLQLHEQPEPITKPEEILIWRRMLAVIENQRLKFRMKTTSKATLLTHQQRKTVWQR